MIEGEQGYLAFKGIRDYIVFTSKRIIAVNVQGMTGKKKDYASLPFAKVQAFSLETAGTFDLDAQLELWFSGLGRVKFEFKARPTSPISTSSSLTTFSEGNSGTDLALISGVRSDGVCSWELTACEWVRSTTGASLGSSMWALYWLAT